MATNNAKEIVRIANKAFSNKQQIDSLHQELALNFYPERADFTDRRIDGEEFSDHLFNSYPVLARRELGNLLAASLRPRARKWFTLHVDDDDIDRGDAERKWLEYVSDLQWRAMYSRGAGLVRATKQTDHDFVTFGNGALYIGIDPDGTGLYFKNYHLRDCAWQEDAIGNVDTVFRKWEPTAAQLERLFPKTISNQVKDMVKRDPHAKVKCLHAAVPSRIYPYKSKFGRKYEQVSMFIERESETVLEEVGQNYFCYVIPRWHTVSGSVYGSSMATSVALPDGRTSQVMMRTLREAGEKFVDPPMLAVTDAIRGDLALYAGGVTTASEEYDERLGDVLRPLTQDRHGMPIGFELTAAIKEDLRSGFFLDKIQLPESRVEMTAFEVRRRLEEHLRASSPIFEPIEDEYSDPMCETVFRILMNYGAVPIKEMPESLRGRETRFAFRSPLADMAERSEAETFLDVRDRILVPMMQIDPSVAEHANWSAATRDAMQAAGWKAEWLNPEEQANKKREELEAQMEEQKQLQIADAAANIAEVGGRGAKQIAEAEQVSKGEA